MLCLSVGLFFFYRLRSFFVSGGEKGVSLLLEADTYRQESVLEMFHLFHSSICQIKVFKVGLHLSSCPWSMLMTTNKKRKTEDKVGRCFAHGQCR